MDFVSPHQLTPDERSNEEAAAAAAVPTNVPERPAPFARFRSIDVLRGVAATLVALRHAFDGPFLVGAIGVDIFFVISGFVMAKVSVGRTAGEFLIDRAWRIYPPYWLALSACTAFAVIQSWALTRADTIGSIFLFPNWFGVGALYLGVAWTLLFELFFYLAVAISIWLRGWRFPLLLFAAALIARPFIANPLIEFAGSPIMIEFMFGMLIALLPANARVGGVLAALALLFLAAFPNPWLEDYRLAMDYWPAFVRVALWGVPAALIVYGALTLEQRFEGALVRALLVIGAASYSIYLWHMVVIKLAFPGQPLLGFAAAMIVGIGMWQLFERRLMKLRPATLVAQFLAPRVTAFQRAMR
jgi:exopolysaccharide production protein ExoZ